MDLCALETLPLDCFLQREVLDLYVLGFSQASFTDERECTTAIEVEPHLLLGAHVKEVRRRPQGLGAGLCLIAMKNDDE